MTGRPDVSVVIPTRNRAAATATAIRSVQAQSGVAVEIIVVDDASSDGSVDVLAGIFGDSITLIRNLTHGGASVARNKGAAVARAPLVAFLDSDDVFLPGKLRLQRDAMNAGGHGFSVTGFRTAGGRRFWISRRALRGLSARNTLGGTSGLMVRTDLIRAEPFADDMPAVQDWELYLRLMRHGPPAILRQPLVVHDTAGSDRITRNARRRALGHRLLQLRHFQGGADMDPVAKSVQALNRTLLKDAARGGLHGSTRAGLWLCRSLLNRLV